MGSRRCCVETFHCHADWASGVQRHAIHRAVAFSGMDDSAFTINAAYKSAIETIAVHEATGLKAVDHTAFFEALDNPPAPTNSLKDAFKRHRETVVSK